MIDALPVFPVLRESALVDAAVRPCVLALTVFLAVHEAALVDVAVRVRVCALSRQLVHYEVAGVNVAVFERDRPFAVTAQVLHLAVVDVSVRVCDLACLGVDFGGQSVRIYYLPAVRVAAFVDNS